MEASAPASPAQPAESAKAMTTGRVIEMPAARASSRPPPKAYISRPQRVKARNSPRTVMTMIVVMLKGEKIQICWITASLMAKRSKGRSTACSVRA
jgi:hypothetical protein